MKTNQIILIGNKRKTILPFLFLIAVLFLFPACKKYDEGGKLKRSEHNISHGWHMEKAWKNESTVEYINDNPQITEVTEDWLFNEDGTCTTDGPNDTYHGTWSFVNSREGIEINMVGSVVRYEIKKLTSGTDGEMIWEYSMNGNHYRFLFTSLL